jgi:hypothetical protein
MVASKKGCVFPPGSGEGYMKLSPYGVWNVTLANPGDFNKSGALEYATGVRFDFNLQGNTIPRAQNRHSTVFDPAVELMTNRRPTNCVFNGVFEVAKATTACNAEQPCSAQAREHQLRDVTHKDENSRERREIEWVSAAAVGVVLGTCACQNMRCCLCFSRRCGRDNKNQLHSRLNERLDANDAFDDVRRSRVV